MEKVCIVCRSNLINKQQKFCSRKCQGKNDYFLNKERYAKLSRDWEKKHPERTKESRKKAFAKFYSTKRERFNELMLNQYRRNKEKWRLRKKHNYRREKILNAVNNKCEICDSIENLEIHHVNYDKPKIEYPHEDLDLANIKVWCRTCHKKHHNKARSAEKLL